MKTIEQVKRELRGLKAEHNYPTMVLVMADFCKSRGYVPRDKSVNEMVIQFFQGDAMDRMTLVGEFDMPELYAQSFMVDLRHFREFNGI